MTSLSASSEEIVELLGEHVDEAIIERLADTHASVEQIAEALDDLEHEHRFGERRIPGSATVAEVRTILEELPFDEDEDLLDKDEDEGEGLTIVNVEDLREPVNEP